MIGPTRGISICLVALVAFVGVGLAYSPLLEVAHEYADHEATIADVEYDSQHGIVWSLDEDGGLVGYDVAEEAVTVTDAVGTGHALAVGDGVVYVADGNTLWEFDVDAEERTEVATLEDHPAAIEYDADREVVWAAGHETVYGYAIADGSLFMRYTEHTDGLSDLAVGGDYVASGTTWEREVVVYDVENERVAFEPELPDDVQGVTAVHVTDDGEVIVGTGADDGDVVAMFDVERGEKLVQYREHVFSVPAVEYLEGEDVIVSAGFDNTIKFYDVESESVVAAYEHDDTIYTADLDGANALLWFGDGEERTGTVTGLDVADEAPSDDERAGGEPADDEPEGQVDEQRTDGDETPGFGIGAALAGLAAASYLVRRRLATEAGT